MYNMYKPTQINGRLTTHCLCLLLLHLKGIFLLHIACLKIKAFSLVLLKYLKIIGVIHFLMFFFAKYKYQIDFMFCFWRIYAQYTPYILIVCNTLALQQVLFSLQSFLRIAAGELPSEIPKLNSTPRPW